VRRGDVQIDVRIDTVILMAKPISDRHDVAPRYIRVRVALIFRICRTASEMISIANRSTGSASSRIPALDGLCGNVDGLENVVEPQSQRSERAVIIAP
jgi:hypothetical protein